LNDARRQHSRAFEGREIDVTNDAERQNRRPRSVGIVLFDEVEVLDFAGPYEVFSGARDEHGDTCLRVITVAARSEVRCRGGLRVLVDSTFADCPPLDAVVVPGGPGADVSSPEQADHVIPFLRERASQSRSEEGTLVASVCTGSFVLARAGLLAGRPVTTHSLLRDTLRAEFPCLDVRDEKVVDDGLVVTAAGVSSGIDLALHLLERWFGLSVRERSARNLDGVWR
jgi:transcriptional regulator GlxA family with amidase domain